jgi:uncharacterized protein YpmB
MINKKVVKLFASVSVGIIATFLVYSGLQDSISRPSLSRSPLSADTAIGIVIKEENLTHTDRSDFSTRYVYIKGDGRIFESESNSNTMGKYIHKISEPTITTGNHFAWEIKYNNGKGNHSYSNSIYYYVDHVTGEIIAKSSLRT